MSAEGVPTTDPETAIAGLILPMAGHKGYAISFMMDVLSGVLTGSAFGESVAGPYQTEKRSGAGHLYVALDVAAFLPVAEFDERMERLVAEVKSVPTAQGFEEIFFPGELEARAEARHRRDGVVLPEQTRSQLCKLAEETGGESAFV
jgi:LDH2 family malate/lactate/ureidoglycolate dehydrogenase